MRIVLLLVLALLARPLMAEGQDSLHQAKPFAADSVQRIEEVIIAKTRRPPIILPQTMPRKELENLHAHSIADALRYFSGVQLKDYGGVGGLKTINVRAMGSEHVGVSYDGIPLSNAMNGQIDLGQYALDNVESISLHNGQNSDLFISAIDYSSANSVSIQTRYPRFANGSNSNIFSTIRIGSFGLINPYFRLEERVSNRTAATLNVEWKKAHGEFPFRLRPILPNGDRGNLQEATRDFSDVQTTRAEGAMLGQAGGGAWSVRVYHYNSSRGIPGPVVNNVVGRDEILGERNSFVQGRYEQSPREWYRYRVAAKYAHYYTRYANHDPNAIYLDKTFTQQEAYFSTTHLFTPLPWLSGTAAYDLQYNHLASMDLVRQQAPYGFAFPSRFVHYAAAALRAEHYGLRAQGSLLVTLSHHKTEDGPAAPPQQACTPSVLLGYSPPWCRTLSIHAYAKSAYRLPTFNDLYYTNFGTPGLKPEHSWQYDLGLRVASPSDTPQRIAYECVLDGYYNRVEDKIVAFPRGGQFRWSMLNLGRVDILGIDTHLHMAYSPSSQIRIRGKLQYTLQRAVDLTSPATAYYGHQIPYIPLHAGAFTCSIAAYGAVLNYSFIYSGDRFSKHQNLREYHLRAWYTHDLSLSYATRFWRSDWRFTAEVNNLLSQSYELILGYPMPGRNYKFIIQIEI